MEIVNRKASFMYQLLDKFEAGIALVGTEVKSVRDGKANLNDAYCYFKGDELFVRSLHIGPFEQAEENHEPRRDRKLLLKKHELRKLKRKTDEKGMTIIPTRLYVSDRGLIKLEIALAAGKRDFDKRQSIKEKDMRREMQRKGKYY